MKNHAELKKSYKVGQVWEYSRDGIKWCFCEESLAYGGTLEPKWYEDVHYRLADFNDEYNTWLKSDIDEYALIVKDYDGNIQLSSEWRLDGLKYKLVKWSSLDLSRDDLGLA